MSGIESSSRLFPAWAGVILMQGMTKDFELHFPRMGGGDPGSRRAKRRSMGFSPHGRG